MNQPPPHRVWPLIGWMAGAAVAGGVAAAGVLYCVMTQAAIAHALYAFLFPIERMFHDYTGRGGLGGRWLAMTATWALLAALLVSCRNTYARVAIVAAYVGFGLLVYLEIVKPLVNARH